MKKDLKDIKVYPDITIQFDEKKHVFYRNGKRLISVTGATGVIDKSAPLMGWAVKLFKEFMVNNMKELINGESETEITPLIEEGSKQHRVFKKKASDIGTLAHEWIEDWIAGKKPDLPTQNDKVLNCVTAFLKYQKENELKFTESEKIIYSETHNYAGILDAVAKKGGDVVLIDFKSSKGIYPEHYLQTAGYQLAYEEQEGKNIDHRLIIKLGKEDGSFEVHEIKEGYMEDKGAFLAALKLRRRLEELKKLKNS